MVYVARVEEKRNAYRILVGELEGKRQIVGTWFEMEESDEVGLKERKWKIVDSISVARDRQKWRAVVNTVTNSEL